jgi:FAD/FMN-containing dehydrogenase
MLSRGDVKGFRGIFRADAEARAIYSESAGIQRILPAAITVPKDVEDLVALLEWAKTEGAGLIPRGSGSSMSGAAVGPGVIVDLSRWKNVDESRIDERRLIVQPGVICAEVQRIAQLKGLRFPVSPSSAAFCTIGGMTATNAAGAHTLAYGAMREWVSAIDWVNSACHPERACHPESVRRSAPQDRLREGSALSGKEQIPRFARDDSAARDDNVRKNSSGYFTEGDEVDLLVGSEGTLGFFTSIELRLTEEPRSTASVMGIFPSLAAATEAAIHARESGAAACELLDRTFLEFVEKQVARFTRDDIEAILLADVEGSDEREAAGIAERIASGFKAAGATDARIAETHAEREHLWELRHAASPILSRLSAQLKSMQVVEDGCVPPPRLGEYVAGLRAAFDAQRIRGVIFGHAGDAHVHANALVDVTEPDWRQRVEHLLDEVTALVATLGGTLAGEHGDGRLRTPLLGRVFPPERMAAFEAIKRKYDPDGRMNPGVKVRSRGREGGRAGGREGGRAGGIGNIKYDPELPAHPDAVSRALTEIEQARAYGRFRLDLI